MKSYREILKGDEILEATISDIQIAMKKMGKSLDPGIKKALSKFSQKNVGNITRTEMIKAFGDKKLVDKIIIQMSP
jgi:hypothetical protein